MADLAAVFNFPAESEPAKRNPTLQNTWHRVLGKRVQVRLEDRLIRAGLAEEVTADDGILWIAADGADCRALFERARGYSVWAH